MAFAALRAITPGVSAQHQALAFRELSAMLRAGLPLDQALMSVALAGPVFFRNALQDLGALVSNGTPLSEGLRHYTTLFHPLVPAIVMAGEATGDIASSFNILAEFFESEAQLRRDLQQALIYPSIVVVFAIFAVAVLSYVGIMDNTWAVRLTWVVGSIVAVWLLLKLRVAQKAARYFAMLLPYFGAIMQQLAVARFCYGFGSLCRAGIPYLEGLQISQQLIEHPLVLRAAEYVYYGVRNGNTVEDSIRSQHAFPPVVHNLIAAGEVSGSLDSALLKAGEYLRQDAEYKIKNASKLAGPVLTIAVGVIVLLILITFLQGYFDLIFSLVEE